MHFSIPETEELGDTKAKSYTGYSLHINGVYHCLVRYRQLHSLHEQLKREFHANTLPTFPPKKLFNLTEKEVEDRRLCLEKYMQLISQDPRVSNSQTFNTFLLAAQKETRRERTENISLDVFLMNEHKVTVSVTTTEQTDVVLDQVCAQLNIPEDFVSCFSLFLIRRDDDGDITVLRKLQDFESPYISQKALSANINNENMGPIKIVLRKSSWDSSVDDGLLAEQATLNLLYIQTVADLERDWIVTSAETKQQLALMQARGSKRQFMEVARTLKFYGYLVFRPCITDHPEPHTRVTVAIGKSVLNMRILSPSGETKEVCFKITRMRCWRIMRGESTTTTGNQVGLLQSEGSKLELSFEYLVTPDTLEWVTVVSSQSILMSMCLQSMVEELVRIRAGEKEPSRITRCGVRRGPTKGRTGQDQSPEAEDGCGGPVDYTVRRLAERFSVVNMKSTSKAAEEVFVENEVFNCSGEGEELSEINNER